MTDQDGTEPLESTSAEHKALSPAAERALKEAAERRKAYKQAEAARPVELGGRGGMEPGRYGDWELKGLTSYF